MMFRLLCFTFVWTFIIIKDVLSDSLTSKRFVIYTTRKTWNEAQTICKDAGGRLAMIDNKATQEALLAYSTHPDHVWGQYMNGDFWIGLNKEAYSSTFRWDQCEPVTGSSFTHWALRGQQNLENSHCVLASTDTLEWRTDGCNNERQFLCENNGGPCAYKYIDGVCTSATYQYEYKVNQFQCEDKCSTELYNDLACWMYSHYKGTCTLNFDADPDTCSSPTEGASTAGIRTCFIYAVMMSASTASQTDSVPLIDCNLNTIQELTTGDPTKDSVTGPTRNLTAITITTISETTTTSLTLTSTQTTTTTETSTTTAVATTQPSTTTTTPAATTIQTRTTAAPPTATLVTTTTTTTTTANKNTADSTTMITKRVESSEIQYSALSSSTTVNPTSGNHCQCLTCLPVKNNTELQELVDALLAWLKVDPTKMSAARRRKKSAPDERPSAQAIGRSGIVFLVISFSFFVIIDMARFVKFSFDQSSASEK